MRNVLKRMKNQFHGFSNFYFSSYRENWGDDVTKMTVFFLIFNMYMKIRNRLNRKKNPVSNFSNYYFSSHDHFWSFLWRHHPNLRWIFHDNSKNKIMRILKLFLSLYSANCASFMIVGSKLRRSGVCLSFLGTGPLNLNYFEEKKMFKNIRTFLRKKNSEKKNPGLQFLV